MDDVKEDAQQQVATVDEAATKKQFVTYGKKGLDVAKVEYVMGREQERDLRIIYRADELQLFVDNFDRMRNGASRYHFQRNPGDPPLIQAAWEAHKQYVAYKESDDPKTALAWYKELIGIISKIQEMRKDAMDRMFIWKKQAEEKANMTELGNEELEKLANG
jgi:hypothetical protein